MVKRAYLSLVGLLVALGCKEATHTRYVTSVREPVFGVTQDVGGNHAIVLDTSEGNEGRLFSIDVYNGNVVTLEERLNPHSWSETMIESGKAVINVHGGGQADIIILDLVTGRKLFDTDTSDSVESIIGGNEDRILFSRYGQTGRNDILTIGLVGGAFLPQSLFPDDPNISGEPNVLEQWINANTRMIYKNEGVTSEAHVLDVKTGNTTLLARFDRNVTTGFAGFGLSTDKIVSYYDFSQLPELIFRDVQNNMDFRFQFLNAQNKTYHPLSISNDGLHAMVAEVDLANRNNWDLIDVQFVMGQNGPNTIHSYIDFSQFSSQGWEARDVVLDSGRQLVGILGRSNGNIPELLFYNRSTGRVEDKITPYLGGSLALDIDVYHYNGKALIQLDKARQNGNSGVLVVENPMVLVFNGDDILNPFGAYDVAFVTTESQDSRYATVTAERDITITDPNGMQVNKRLNDLYLWDNETQTGVVIASIMDGSLYGGRFSDGGTKVAYMVRDNSNNVSRIGIYECLTSDNRQEVFSSPDWLDVRKFKDDGALLIGVRSQPDRDVHFKDGKATTIAYH